MEISKADETREYTLTDINEVAALMSAVDALTRLNRLERHFLRRTPEASANRAQLSRRLFEARVDAGLNSFAAAGVRGIEPRPPLHLVLTEEDAAVCVSALEWVLTQPRLLTDGGQAVRLFPQLLHQFWDGQDRRVAS